VGFLLVGCGGPEADGNETSTEPVLSEAQQGICEGFNNGAYWCTAECNDGENRWYYVGTYPGIPNGGCASAAEAFCRNNLGVGHNGACWSF
jgi:hypothetical protein